jgi:hypothetical protein
MYIRSIVGNVGIIPIIKVIKYSGGSNPQPALMLENIEILFQVYATYVKMTGDI